MKQRIKIEVTLDRLDEDENFSESVSETLNHSGTQDSCDIEWSVAVHLNSVLRKLFGDEAAGRIANNQVELQE